jgi:hypothetical protein
MLAYRLLLLAFPADVRRQFGDDMAAMFAKQMAEVKREKRSRVWLWGRAAMDAALGGMHERLRAQPPQGNGCVG